MDQTSKKILIVDDEKPLANALKLKLSHEGFQVEVAHDGQQALDELNKTNYDIMLLDLVMPKLDGFGVLEQLQTKPIKPKIIVSSNLSQEEDFKRAKSLGASEYFIKSNTPLSEIVEKIKKMI